MKTASGDARAGAVPLHDRAFCIECGLGVGFDEDGLCTGCGNGVNGFAEVIALLEKAGFAVERLCPEHGRSCWDARCDVREKP